MSDIKRAARAERVNDANIHTDQGDGWNPRSKTQMKMKMMTTISIKVECVQSASSIVVLTSLKLV
jgi:hypothetical protein